MMNLYRTLSPVHGELLSFDRRSRDAVGPFSGQMSNPLLRRKK